MSPEKSSATSLEKGLKVRSEKRVQKREKSDRRKPLQLIEEKVEPAAELWGLAVVAVAADRRWRSEVRSSRISR